MDRPHEAGDDEWLLKPFHKFGVLAGTHDPQDIFINPLTWYEENNITLHAGKRVSAIDPVAKVVRAGDDLVEPYDKLVIATGSSPFVPALENLIDGNGKFKDGAFVFRTMDDCQEMIEYATNARKAVVVGGGLLGLEAARGLRPWRLPRRRRAFGRWR